MEGSVEVRQVRDYGKRPEQGKVAIAVRMNGHGYGEYVCLESDLRDHH
ncbi:MAG: hypothetical protein UU76_C0013G0013 [Parcubacteria group bacterium GW2011_GWC1_41_7]|nr:MAG: hypothetical protein UU76_C0013G0013 [Parcubacteria group bacterium GW2011_GWC1_41_7]